MVGLLAAAYIFLLCMTTQSVVKWTAMLLMVAAFIIQNCIFPLLPFLSASPNLLLIFTFS